MDNNNPFETNVLFPFAEIRALEHKMERPKVFFLLCRRRDILPIERSLAVHSDLDVEPTWCFDPQRALAHLCGVRYHAIVVRATREVPRLECLETLCERIRDTAVIVLRDADAPELGKKAIARGAFAQFSTRKLDSPAFGFCLRFAWYHQMAEHPLQPGAVRQLAAVESAAWKRPGPRT